MRDISATQSVLLAEVLLLSDETSCHCHVSAQGIEMGLVKIPLHSLFRNTLVSDMMCVGMCDQLLVKGVSMILGNNLAGEKVTPLLEVNHLFNVQWNDPSNEEFAKMFPACAVTRAQSRKFKDIMGLADTFLACVKDFTDILESLSLQMAKV